MSRTTVSPPRDPLEDLRALREEVAEAAAGAPAASVRTRSWVRTLDDVVERLARPGGLLRNSDGEVVALVVLARNQGVISE